MQRTARWWRVRGTVGWRSLDERPVLWWPDETIWQVAAGRAGDRWRSWRAGLDRQMYLSGRVHG